MSEAKRLSLELERAAVRAIFATYTDLNQTFFKGRLKRPTLEMSDAAVRLGEWFREARRLRLSRKLLSDHGWGALVEVLKHEMAHQYVDEILGAVDETAHGPTFRQVCEERGFDARAAGMPDPTGIPRTSPVLERIAKLLALAESSNEHEAQAAMSAAQRLMLKHNLSDVTRGDGESLAFRHLGKPTGRVTEAERILANILVEHFFVDTIWVPVWRAAEGKRGSVLEVCGRDENLEMADYVHAFLTRAAERLWKEHRKAHKIRGNRDRRAYVAGVMSGFEKKLGEEARKNAAEGLVWVGDPGVERFFKQRHPRIRWTRHVSSRNSDAHQRGVEAGKRIVLHKGVGNGPGGGGPKLLTR